MVRPKIRSETVEHVLSAQELTRIPGAQNDALKAAQNLPGVARAPLGAGQLVVWGSAPGDTRVYADGVLIPRIYHFGGLRSTLNSEFITSLAFRPGAYGADYGRGLGGVIDVQTALPDTQKLRGSVTLDLIDGSFFLSGPLSSKLSMAAAGRVSWIGAILPLLTQGDPQLTPFYWDYQLALRYRISPRDDLEVFVFGSTSDIGAKVENPDPNVRVNIKSKSYFGRARLRYVHRFSPETVLTVTPSFGADTFSLDTGEGVGGQPLSDDTFTVGYNLRAELRHRLHPLLDFAAGVDFEGSRTSVNALAAAGGLADGEVEGVPSGSGDQIRDAAKTEGGSLGDRLFAGGGSILREKSIYHLVAFAPYLIARFRLWSGRILISPQLRLEVDHLRGPPLSLAGEDGARTLVNLEPRLQIQIQLVPERLLLKAGAGRYHQPPRGPELSPIFGNPELGLQVGTTYVVGAEVSATSTLRIEVQGFYKDLRSLIVPDAATIYSNQGQGRVYGGELLVRQQLLRNFFGWLSYTLSRSERKDRPWQEYYPYRFDQTHIFTILGSYRLPYGIEVGVRFRYVTGNPTTPTVGGVRIVEEQRYGGIAGPRNSARLPEFHQLDVRIDKSFPFRKWSLSLYLDLQNVYNRRNTEYLVYGGRQLYQVGEVGGLPFFPNLGMRADF